jgi:hypothetical protein
MNCKQKGGVALGAWIVRPGIEPSNGLSRSGATSQLCDRSIWRLIPVTFQPQPGFLS